MPERINTTMKIAGEVSENTAIELLQIYNNIIYPELTLEHLKNLTLFSFTIHTNTGNFNEIEEFFIKHNIPFVRFMEPYDNSPDGELRFFYNKRTNTYKCNSNGIPYLNEFDFDADDNNNGRISLEMAGQFLIQFLTDSQNINIIKHTPFKVIVGEIKHGC